MRQTVWHHALILLVAALVLLTNLGGARLWDQDEPRNAGCALEMMNRGDWVVPMFNDQLRDAKPVLLYWLIMSAYAVFGVNELAARLWSALLGIATVVATYQIGRRLFNAQAALWGALVLSTSLMFDVAGRAATPDSALIFCGTAALMVYVLATFKPRSAATGPTAAPQPRRAGQYFPASRGAVVLMYGLMAVGVLAKGPVGMVLPTAVIGMFLLLMRLPDWAAGVHQASAGSGPTPRPAQPDLRRIFRIVAVIAAFGLVAVRWGTRGLIVGAIAAAAGLLIAGRRRWLKLLRPFAPRHFLRTCWSMRPVTAIAVVAAVALPWYVLVGLRTDGDFLRGFLIREHFGRATAAMENHDGSLLFYPAAILAGFFPWSVFMAPMLIGLVQRLRRRDAWSVGYLFLACWVGVYVGLFTLAATKLPSYVTPCYPALALLAGCFIYHWTRGTAVASRLWLKLSIGSLALVGLIMLIAIPIAAHRYLPGDQWLAVVALIPLAGAGAAWRLTRQRRPHSAAWAVAVSAVAFAVVLFGFVTEQVDRHRQYHILFRAIAHRTANPRIGCFGPLEPSWVFYSGHPIRTLRLEPDAHPERERSKAWHAPRPLDVAAFFASGADAFVITPESHLQQLAPKLPKDVGVLAKVDYFLKKDRLVLLGRLPQQPHVARRRLPIRRTAGTP